MTAIKTCNLTKKYKEKTAVSNLNLQIEKGKIYGLLGEAKCETPAKKHSNAESAF